MYSQSALVSTPVVAEEFETFATYDKQSEFSHNLHSNIVDEFHFLFEPDHMTCPVSSVCFLMSHSSYFITMGNIFPHVINDPPVIYSTPSL